MKNTRMSYNKFKELYLEKIDNFNSVYEFIKVHKINKKSGYRWIEMMKKEGVWKENSQYKKITLGNPEKECVLVDHTNKATYVWDESLKTPVSPLLKFEEEEFDEELEVVSIEYDALRKLEDESFDYDWDEALESVKAWDRLYMTLIERNTEIVFENKTITEELHLFLNIWSMNRLMIENKTGAI